MKSIYFCGILTMAFIFLLSGATPIKGDGGLQRRSDQVQRSSSLSRYDKRAIWDEDDDDDLETAELKDSVREAKRWETELRWKFDDLCDTIRELGMQIEQIREDSTYDDDEKEVEIKQHEEEMEAKVSESQEVRIDLQEATDEFKDLLSELQDHLNS